MQFAAILRTVLARLIAAGTLLTLTDALLPKGEDGVLDGAKRLIKLALMLGVLAGIGL